ncbi:MAG: calcium/sodium antiporter [Lentisphaeria bacterium]|nr:calcium/sodium antiporter [Candidatus Neomarinimicrobiota bacterium]MCF7842612.1 calcium/sodium antiporter [Lentisphaeria bacterium]
MLTIIFFIIGFVILIKGADWLVEGAAALAKRFRVPDLLVGLTVVAFGTSLPELFVNIFASFSGSSDLAMGNVVGSNITNILLILGVAGLIYPLSVKGTTIYQEIPFSLLAVVLLGVLANDHLLDGAQGDILSRTDGIVFFIFFMFFMYYVFGIARKFKGIDGVLPDGTQRPLHSLGQILLGMVGLALGGKWIVDGAIYLSQLFGASESFIGLTVVALGTSLPELATSAIAATKKNADIAVGNVVGSNIFNIFFVLGISAMIKPLPIQTSANTDIGVVIVATLFLFATNFLGQKRILERREAVILLLGYLGYMVFLVMRG